MKLRNRPLERRLWKRIRGEIRRSRDLRKEFKKVRKSYPSRLRTGSSLFSLWILPLFLVSNVFTAGRRPDACLLALSLLVGAAACFLATSFRANLYWSTDVYVLSHYPVSDHDFFRRQWNKLLRASLWIPLTTAFVFLGVIWISQGPPLSPGQWLMTGGLCLSQWILMLGLALFTAKRLLHIRLDLVGFALIGLAILALVSSRYVSTMADQIWPWLSVFPPVWINYAFLEGVIGNNLTILVLAIPAVCVIPLFPGLYRSFRETYTPGDVIFGVLPSADIVRDMIAESQPVSVTGSGFLERGQLLTHRWTGVSLMETLCFKWLDRREQDLAAFLTGETLSWSSRWQKAALIAIASTLLLTVSVKYAWLAVAGYAISTMMAAPVLGGGWRGIEPVQWGPLSGPLHGNYPVGFWELSRVMLKVNVIRILFWAGVVLVIAALLGWKLLHAPGASAVLAGRGLFILLAIQPFFIGGRLIGNTSGESRITWRSFLVATALLAFFLVMVAGSVCLLAGRHLSIQGLGLVLVTVPSLLAWGLCGWVYTHARYDLLHQMRSSS